MFISNVVLIYLYIAPAADCTDDFMFNRTKYNDKERGLKHLDGFVDCEAAPEGNQYYVEQYNITGDESASLLSCFKPDGLCLTLTNFNDGGWPYMVYDLQPEGNNSRIHDQRSSFQNFSPIMSYNIKLQSTILFNI